MALTNIVSQTFKVTLVLGKGIYVGQFNFCVLKAANSDIYVLTK